jgi:hypothetical protein
MNSDGHISAAKTNHTPSVHGGNILAEANTGGPSKGFEAMARRRFQSPKPFREGQFWWLRVWDTNLAGSRKRQRIKLAPADLPVREVQKIAEEKLRPVNQGLALTGSAMNFQNSVGGRPEIGTGPDASRTHSDHDGNLRSDCSCSAAASDREAVRVCESWAGRFTVHYGPIKRDFR